jgi:hypothetical protein
MIMNDMMLDVDAEDRLDTIRARTANQVRSISAILLAINRGVLEDMFYEIAETSEPVAGLGLNDIRPVLSMLQIEDHLQQHRQ